MKKVFFFIVMVAIATIAVGQTHPTKVGEKKSTQGVKVDNKTFKASSKKSGSSDYRATGYYYETSKGDRYEIYTHTISRGDNAGKKACYIKRVSKKTGKEYWQKIDILPSDLK